VQVLNALQTSSERGLVLACRLEESSRVLEAWYRLSQTAPIGVSKEILAQLARVYQMMGRYGESREVGRTCVKMCSGWQPGHGMVGVAVTAVPGHPDLEVCSACSILTGDYKTGFALVRARHRHFRGEVGSVDTDTVTMMRLEHDAEQIEYLYSQVTLTPTPPHCNAHC